MKPYALWVTSFGKDMLKCSGRPLIESFTTSQSEGHLLVYAEGCAAELRAKALPQNVTVVDLDADDWLRQWLGFNADVIPEALGGSLESPECRCPGGPLDPHSRNHKMPCPGHWFCKNASRWFRKQASLRDALAQAREGSFKKAEVIVWVDSDCRFVKKVTGGVLRNWFPDSAGVFYHRSKRPVLEAGVVGYFLNRGGARVINYVLDQFWTGNYRSYERWDDCMALQLAMAKLKDVKTADLATKVGEHAAVIDHSPVGKFIQHDKGRHGRKLGIMK